MDDETPHHQPATEAASAAPSPADVVHQFAHDQSGTQTPAVPPAEEEGTRVGRQIEPGEGSVPSEHTEGGDDSAADGRTPHVATAPAGVEAERAQAPPRRRFRERSPAWWMNVLTQPGSTTRENGPPSPANATSGETGIGDTEGARPAAAERLPLRQARFHDRERSWWIAALAGRGLRPTASGAGLADRIVAAPSITLLAIVALGAFLRFYNLDDLPGEIFGDMVVNLGNTSSILHGDWRILYGYPDARESMLFFLNALSAQFFGNTYLTLKTTAALIGIATIPACYLLAKEMLNRSVGLLTAFLVAVSKWPLIFSRIGFRAVLTPLFVALTWYFFVRAYRYERRRDFVMAGVLLGLGLYTYTGFRFAVLAVLVVGVLLLVRDRAFMIRNWLSILAFCGGFAVATLPMAIDFTRQPSVYFSHSGPMLFVNGHVGVLPSNWLSVFLGNIVNQLLMYNIRGDIVFRVNPTNDPQVDILSGLLILAGAALWLTKWLPRPARPMRIFLFVPFVVLQFNALLDLNFPIDIPSATRVTGIIPFVYLLIASGLWWLYSLSRKGTAEKAVVALCLLYILILNYDRYFHRYAYGLPNHNTPIGRMIAQDVSNLPTSVHVYVVGCCWGDAGQPEPMGITDALTVPHPISFVDENALSCAYVRREGGSIYMVFPPTMGQSISRDVACLGQGQTTAHSSTYGDIVYYSFEKL